MTKILMHPNGRPMRWGEVYAALGIKGSRLPDEGLAPKEIQGIWIWVEPKIPGRPQDGKRTIAACPFCPKRTGFARLRQHMKVHRDSR